MPTINVIPSWNVKKLTEDQAMSGTIYANGVYKFLYTRDNARLTQIMSIKEIIPVTAEGSDEPIDYKIVPSVIFFTSLYSVTVTRLKVSLLLYLLCNSLIQAKSVASSSVKLLSTGSKLCRL